MKYFRDIQLNNLEDVLLMDIETASIVKELEEGSDLAKSWEYKMRKTGLETFQELKEEFEKSAPLYAPFGKIVCIGVGHIKNGQYRRKEYIGSEKEIFTTFYNDLDQMRKAGKRFLCGFNILKYDVPFVTFRSLLNGLGAHPWFDVAGQKPWELTHILDLSEVLRGTMFASMSLLNCVVAFGLPSPKEDIDGSQVSKAFYNGEINRIAEYCSRDVESTANLLKFLINQ